MDLSGVPPGFAGLGTGWFCVCLVALGLGAGFFIVPCRRPATPAAAGVQGCRAVQPIAIAVMVE